MASRSLGALTVDLILKMGGFTQGMDKAAREVDARRRQMEKSLAGIGKAFAALGVGFSAIQIVSGLQEAAAAAIEFGDEVSKAAAKTGIGAETITELAYAAKQSDIDLTSLSTALKKMQVNMSEAASGSKAANETLTALGLTIGDLQKLSPEEQFLTLADRISALKDPADRARAAVELFGKAGADLLPLFEQGAAGIRALQKEAHDLNATLTGEQAAALAAADDAIKRLHQSYEGFTRQLTVLIAVPLANFMDGVTQAISGQESVWNRVKDAAIGYFQAIVQGGGNPALTLILLTKQIINAGEAASKAAAEAKKFRESFTFSGLAPGGHNRTPFVPGFQDTGADAAAAKAAAAAARAAAAAQKAAAREAEQALRAQADAYKDVLTAGLAAIDGLKTPLEQQLDQYHEAKFALEELARTYPNMADAAAEALKRLEVEGLEVPEITAEKIFPKKEQEQLSEFWLQAQRNTQDILAGFLEDPFKEGIAGMLDDFTKMIRQMAAQALAAQIADKLFHGFDDWISHATDALKNMASQMSSAASSGSSFWSSLAGAAASFFGGSSGPQPVKITATRMAAGGFTGYGDKFAPAGIVHRNEYVLPTEVTSQPGALDFLRAFHQQGMALVHGMGLPGYAMGGLVGSTMVVPGRGVTATSGSGQNMRPNIMQAITINASGGNISRQTELQITAAAARGVRNADRRNN